MSVSNSRAFDANSVAVRLRSRNVTRRSSLTRASAADATAGIHGLGGDSLDLVLFLPGGSAEAAEYLVSYIRTKFKDVRVIVPHAAVSAATMMACSANVIVMGSRGRSDERRPTAAVASRPSRARRERAASQDSVPREATWNARILPSSLASSSERADGGLDSAA
jgi:hypothetical protein